MVEILLCASPTVKLRDRLNAVSPAFAKLRRISTTRQAESSDTRQSDQPVVWLGLRCGAGSATTSPAVAFLIVMVVVLDSGVLKR